MNTLKKYRGYDAHSLVQDHLAIPGRTRWDRIRARSPFNFRIRDETRTVINMNSRSIL